jgi:S-adenosylmethionine hydrolase
MIPVLFLSNQKEVDSVKGYLNLLDKEAVKPAHWVVKRDGHLNVNAHEDLEAFRALVAYELGREIPMENSILFIPEDKPSLAQFTDGGAYTRITRVHPKYGNLDTEFTPSDAEKIGLKKGEPFTVRFGDKQYKVLLGATFGDVAKGEWVAFFQQDGLLKIARNLESAAALLGCKTGDMIFITR